MSKIISILLVIIILPVALFGILSVYTISSALVILGLAILVLFIVLFGVLWAVGMPIEVKWPGHGKSYGSLRWFKFTRSSTKS